MAVEAVFWFFPAVWWLERRLIDERERACIEQTAPWHCRNSHRCHSGDLRRTETFASVCASAHGPPSQAGRRHSKWTGFAGYFDMALELTAELGPPPPPPGVPDRFDRSSAPSIFTALQEQLGLKLESTRGSVDVLIIDHVEPPTPD
jgi:uncharacterized protein (TIGR03435 family)